MDDLDRLVYSRVFGPKKTSPLSADRSISLEKPRGIGGRLLDYLSGRQNKTVVDETGAGSTWTMNDPRRQDRDEVEARKNRDLAALRGMPQEGHDFAKSYFMEFPRLGARALRAVLPAEDAQGKEYPGHRNIEDFLERSDPKTGAGQAGALVGGFKVIGDVAGQLETGARMLPQTSRIGKWLATHPITRGALARAPITATFASDPSTSMTGLAAQAGAPGAKKLNEHPLGRFAADFAADYAIGAGFHKLTGPGDLATRPKDDLISPVLPRNKEQAFQLSGRGEQALWAHGITGDLHGQRPAHHQDIGPAVGSEASQAGITKAMERGHGRLQPLDDKTLIIQSINPGPGIKKAVQKAFDQGFERVLVGKKGGNVAFVKGGNLEQDWAAKVGGSTIEFRGSGPFNEEAEQKRLKGFRPSVTGEGSLSSAIPNAASTDTRHLDVANDDELKALANDLYDSWHALRWGSAPGTPLSGATDAGRHQASLVESELDRVLAEINNRKIPFKPDSRPQYYSRLERALADAPESGTPEEMLRHIENYPEGVRTTELNEATDIGPYLRGETRKVEPLPSREGLPDLSRLPESNQYRVIITDYRNNYHHRGNDPFDPHVEHDYNNYGGHHVGSFNTEGAARQQLAEWRRSQNVLEYTRGNDPDNIIIVPPGPIPEELRGQRPAPNPFVWRVRLRDGGWSQDYQTEGEARAAGANVHAAGLAGDTPDLHQLRDPVVEKVEIPSTEPTTDIPAVPEKVSRADLLKRYAIRHPEIGEAGWGPLESKPRPEGMRTADEISDELEGIRQRLDEEFSPSYAHEAATNDLTEWADANWPRDETGDAGEIPTRHSDDMEDYLTGNYTEDGLVSSMRDQYARERGRYWDDEENWSYDEDDNLDRPDWNDWSDDVNAEFDAMEPQLRAHLRELKDRHTEVPEDIDGEEYQALQTRRDELESELTDALDWERDNIPNFSAQTPWNSAVRLIAADRLEGSKPVIEDKTKGSFRLRVAKYLNGPESQVQVGSHTNQPGEIAHLRMTMREPPKLQGKKVLRVEEVQSDPGQLGEKRGFKGEREKDVARQTQLEAEIAEVDRKLAVVKRGYDPDVPTPDLEAAKAKAYADVEAINRRVAEAEQQGNTRAAEGMKKKLEALNAQIHEMEQGRIETPKAKPERLKALDDKLLKARTGLAAEYDALRDRIRSSSYSTPSNPHTKNADDWVRLMLRRALDEAATSGADAISVLGPRQAGWPMNYDITPPYEANEGLKAFYGKAIRTRLDKELKRLGMSAEERDIGIAASDKDAVPGFDRAAAQKFARNDVGTNFRANIKNVVEKIKAEFKYRYLQRLSNSPKAEAELLRSIYAEVGDRLPPEIFMRHQTAYAEDNSGRVVLRPITGPQEWNPELQAFLSRPVPVTSYGELIDNIANIMGNEGRQMVGPGARTRGQEELFGRLISRKEATEAVVASRENYLDKAVEAEVVAQLPQKVRAEFRQQVKSKVRRYESYEPERFLREAKAPTGEEYYSELTPEAKAHQQKHGVYLLAGVPRGEDIARTLKGPAGRMAVGAGVGAAVGGATDKDDPTRGAIMGAVVGAGAVGAGMKTLRGFQETRANLRAMEEGAVEAARVPKGWSRTTLSDRPLAEWSHSELRRGYTRAVTRLGEATPDMPENVHAALSDDIADMLEEFARRGKTAKLATGTDVAREAVLEAGKHEGMLGGLVRAGSRLIEKHDTDPADFIGRLGRFAMDESGEKALAARVEKMRVAGDIQRYRQPWKETERQAVKLASNWGIKVGPGLDAAINERGVKALDAVGLDALSGLLADNTTALHQAYATMSTMNPLDYRFERLRQYTDMIEHQTDQLLGKFVTSRSEAGRALNILKKQAFDTLDPVFWMTKAKSYLKDEPFTAEHFADINRLIAEKDRVGLAQYVAGLQKATLSQKGLTLWKAGLLTGLRTHEVNFLSNLSMRALESVKDYPAVLFDRVLWGARKFAFEPAGLAKKGGAVLTKAPGLDVEAATIRAIPEAAKKAGKVMRGKDVSDLGKWDVSVNEIQFDNPIANAYTKTVFRMLGASDAAFKVVAFQRSVAEQAKVVAKNAKGGKQMVKDLLLNPTDDMVNRAIYDSQVATFTNKGRLGRAAQAMREPFGAAGHLVLPFTQTPANVAERSLEYSPLGALFTAQDFAKWFKAMGKGESGFDAQRAIAERLGRSAVGTTIAALMGGMWLASKGRVKAHESKGATGFQTDRFYGRQANSAELGDRWYGLDRLSPLGNIVLTGAAMWEIANDPQNSGLAEGSVRLAGDIGKTVSEQSFLQGANQAMDLVQGDEGAGRQFIRGLTGSVVPTLAGQFARGSDAFERDSRGANPTRDLLINPIKAKIPGKLKGFGRESLPVAVDQFGNPVMGPGLARNLLHPLPSTVDQTKYDPTRAEMAKAGVTISSLRRLPDKGDGFGEGPTEFMVRAQQEGAGLKAALDALVRSPQYQNATDKVERKVLIDREIRRYRSSTSRQRNKYQ